MNKTMRLLIAGVAASWMFHGAAFAADARAGKVIFEKTCRKCHSLTAGVNKVGPSLYGIIGRPSAVTPGYEYSASMKALNVVWDDKQLDEYLVKPRADVHGVQMFFKGLPKASDRANVIAFLKRQ